MLDDAHIPGDVKVSIFRQLDPIVRRDRFALYNCLLVSRPYFELAVERLWSSQRLANAFYNNHLDVLLKHVLVADPPSTTDGERSQPSSDAGWRIGVYLQSIRILFCCNYGSITRLESRDPVPPPLLLPWLRKLDSVDIRRADGAWLEALMERLALPGPAPKRLILSRSSTMCGTAALVARIGRRVNSLVIHMQHSEGEDGDCANVFDHFASSGKDGWVKKIAIHGIV
ncbi:hypothetical protein HK101_009182 [Irineochytrium annulatum]|nr:hypothetical protein HK101_009182 [Irineochytrium annulatum]